jgi:hypothetical protein
MAQPWQAARFSSTIACRKVGEYRYTSSRHHTQPVDSAAAMGLQGGRLQNRDYMDA